MNTTATEWTDEEIHILADYGYGLHLEGYNREAATIFEGLLALHPHNTYCRDALAALCLALGHPEDAVRHTSELLSVLPNHSDSLARRCEALIQLGDLDDAERDLAALKRIKAQAHVKRMQLRLKTASDLATSLSGKGPGGFSSPKQQVLMAPSDNSAGLNKDWSSSRKVEEIE